MFDEDEYEEYSDDMKEFSDRETLEYKSDIIDSI